MKISMLKNVHIQLIIAAAIFVMLSTTFTMKRQGASDGMDILGFPFAFYTGSGGKYEFRSDFGFKPSYLLIDFFIALISVYVIHFIVRLIRERK